MSKILSIIYIIFILINQTSYANTQQGLSWLETQVQTVTDSSSQATPYQALSESLVTHFLHQQPSNSTTNSAFDYLQNYNPLPEQSTENISRLIHAYYQAGQNRPHELFTELGKRINFDSDFGLGDLPNYESTVIDSSFALNAAALYGLDIQTAQMLAPVLNYVLAQQQADGSWTEQGNHSQVYITAIAFHALWHYRNYIPAIPAALTQAQSYLLSQRNQDSNWDEDYISAQSLIALLPVSTDNSELNPSISALKNKQTDNGSWGNDAYTTALALRAIHKAESPLLNPDFARLNGIVVRQQGELAMSNTLVTLKGKKNQYEQYTDENGQFLFLNIPPDEYTLEIKDAFISTPVTLQANDDIDLDNIYFVDKDNVLIEGTVLDINTKLPIQGASIKVNKSSGEPYLNEKGEYPVTDKNGKYKIFFPVSHIFDINGNTIFYIEIKKIGYSLSKTDFRVKTTQPYVSRPQTNYSPLLKPTTVRIQGKIVDTETKEPLNNVNITINGNINIQTNELGDYFIEGIELKSYGYLRLRVEHEGYATVKTNNTYGANDLITFSPELRKNNTTVTIEYPKGLRGIILHEYTGDPVPNISIGLIKQYEKEPYIMTTTDADGKFLLMSDDISNRSKSYRLYVEGHGSTSSYYPLLPSIIRDIGEFTRLYDSLLESTVGFKGQAVDAVTGDPIEVEVIMMGVTHVYGYSDKEYPHKFYTKQKMNAWHSLEYGWNFQVTAPNYQPIELNVLHKINTLYDAGIIKMNPINNTHFLPNLSITDVHKNLQLEEDGLQFSGEITVDIENLGNTEIDKTVELIAYYDYNKDGLFDAGSDDLLGINNFSQEEIKLNSESDLYKKIAVEGILPFRDAPISLFIDSKQHIIEESEHDNKRSTEFCGVNQDITFKPVIKWQAHSLLNEHTMPIVIPLTDTNGDNLINQQDDSVIIVSPSPSIDPNTNSLQALDGKTGELIWHSAPILPGLNQATDEVYPGELIAGDFDKDGKPEIAFVQTKREVLNGNYKYSLYISFLSNTGEIVRNIEIESGDGAAASSAKVIDVFDYDQDGITDFSTCGKVYDIYGNLKWAPDDLVLTDYPCVYRYIADTDADGLPELAYGNGRGTYKVYNSQGELIGDDVGNIQMAGILIDFDHDNKPDNLGRNSLVRAYDKKTLWIYPGAPSGAGQPSIADIDGDGFVEISAAGGYSYQTYEHNGAWKWGGSMDDYTGGGGINAFAFDFNRNKRNEVVFMDANKLIINDGLTGKLLGRFELPLTIPTVSDQIRIVDLDNDNHAEIMIGIHPGRGIGWSLVVIEDTHDSWAAARSILHKSYRYHPEDINDDLTFPDKLPTPYLTYNTNTSELDDKNIGTPELTAAALHLTDHGNNQPQSLSVRIGNAGTKYLEQPNIVAFYNGDTLLGEAQVPALEENSWTDVVLDGISNLDRSQNLRAVVNPHNSIEECDLSNNEAITTVAALPQGNLQLSLDNDSYQPGDSLPIQINLNNTGSLPANYQVLVEVQDKQGNLIHAFPAYDVTGLEGGSQQQQQLTWQDDSLLNGQYQLVASLKDNSARLLDQTQLDFSFDEGQMQLSLRTQTDKVLYHSTDTVRIDQYLNNLSKHQMLDNITVIINVHDANGQLVHNAIETLGQVPPDSSSYLNMVYRYTNLAEGSYTLTSQINHAGETTGISNSQTFEVKDQLNRNITGQIQASPVLVPDQALSEYQVQASVQQHANRAQDLDIRLQLLNLEPQQVLESREQTLALAATSTEQRQKSFFVDALASGNYIFALQFYDGNTWQTLDYEQVYIQGAAEPCLTEQLNRTNPNRQTLSIGDMQGTYADTPYAIEIKATTNAAIDTGIGANDSAYGVTLPRPHASSDFRTELKLRSLNYGQAAMMLSGKNPESNSARYAVYYDADDRALSLHYRDNDQEVGYDPLGHSIPVNLPIELAIEKRANRVHFSYSTDEGQNWQTLGMSDIHLEELELSLLSISKDPTKIATARFGNDQTCAITPAPQARAHTCEAEQPLDLLYLLDISSSMEWDYLGGGTKIEAAYQTIEALNQQLAARQDGSRVALISYTGYKTAEQNLAEAAVLRTPWTTNYDEVLTRRLETRAYTAAALGFQAVDDYLKQLTAEKLDNHRQLVIWIGDGMPNIDLQGQGAEYYEITNLHKLPLYDTQGKFYSWQQLNWSGDYIPGLTGYEGKAIGDTMMMIETLKQNHPEILIYPVTLQGVEKDEATTHADLPVYAAWHTGAQKYHIDSAAGPLAAATALLQHSHCEIQGE